MNYIKKLQLENKEKDEKLAAIREDVNALYRYLQSEKFYTNTYVNKNDIFLRLENVQFLLNAI